MPTYDIFLRNLSNEETGNKAIAGSQSTENSKPKSKTTPGQDALKGGLVAWQKAKGWINKVASHELSMVELRTGSTEAQQKADFIYQLANEGIGTVESALMGLAIGNVPGALIGIGTDLLGKVVSYSQKADKLNTSRNLENESIQRNYIRAGARGSRASYE